MDEDAYRLARAARQPVPCVFEKALATACAACSLSARSALAERESIGCTSARARDDCARFAALARERSAFALRLAPGAVLAHAAALRLQCGSLAGLRACVEPGEQDVARLVAGALARFGSLADLPWPGIVAAVAAWTGRRPHRRSPA
jgi:hypothetical protein